MKTPALFEDLAQEMHDTSRKPSSEAINSPYYLRDLP